MAEAYRQRTWARLQALREQEEREWSAIWEGKNDWVRTAEGHFFPRAWLTPSDDEKNEPDDDQDAGNGGQEDPVEDPVDPVEDPEPVEEPVEGE